MSLTLVTPLSTLSGAGRSWNDRASAYDQLYDAQEHDRKLQAERQLCDGRQRCRQEFYHGRHYRLPGRLWFCCHSRQCHQGLHQDWRARGSGHCNLLGLLPLSCHRFFPRRWPSETVALKRTSQRSMETLSMSSVRFARRVPTRTPSRTARVWNRFFCLRLKTSPINYRKGHLAQEGRARVHSGSHEHPSGQPRDDSQPRHCS